LGTVTLHDVSADDAVPGGAPAGGGGGWRLGTGRQGGARTTGTDPDVRMLLFRLSAFVCNMWAVERAWDGLWCARKEFTMLAMTCALVYAAADACNRGFPGPPPDRGCL